MMWLWTSLTSYQRQSRACERKLLCPSRFVSIFKKRLWALLTRLSFLRGGCVTVACSFSLRSLRVVTGPAWEPSPIPDGEFEHTVTVLPLRSETRSPSPHVLAFAFFATTARHLLSISLSLSLKTDELAGRLSDILDRILLPYGQ